MVEPASPSPRALIVDDDVGVRRLVAQLMSMEGIDCTEVGDGEAALASLRQGQLDLALLDVNLPNLSGMKVLKEAKKSVDCPPIIMMTGCGSVGAAVEAVKNGAYDYISKPFENDELVFAVRRALESNRLHRENRRLRSQIDGEHSLRTLMGPSDPIGKLIREIERVAPTDFTVLIGGETGSGKELVAQAVHRLGGKAGSFVPVDCGAVQPTLIESELFGHEKGAFTGADRARPGKIEAAAGGTLFLDEVQNLPLALQTSLLRALQERQICRVGGTKSVHIDFRVVAASNQNLTALVSAGQFRQDLYHRLNEFSLVVPPLRDRREDIVYLAKRFLDLTCAEVKRDVPRIHSESLELLLNYSWPGNVRELRNVLRRAVLLAEHEILPEHLGFAAPCPRLPPPPEEFDADVGLLDGRQSLKEIVRRKVEQVERKILLQALRQTHGNKAKAARLLHVDYKTIQNKTKEYGLGRPPLEEDSVLH